MPDGSLDGLDDFDEDAADVRPYTVTGGRTRPGSVHLPIEALVESVTSPSAGRNTEERRILALADGQYLSIAEISAHLHLPVGVVRVLVGDLGDAGHVRLHGLTATDPIVDPAATLSVLESVLDGISAL